MPTEMAQMISFTYYHEEHWNNNLSDLLMNFNKAHDKHPCSLWLRESAENFYLACEIGIELVQEYRYRYDSVKHQRALDIFMYGILNPPIFNSDEQTQFALAMPDEYKVDCPIESYRNYYRKDKKHLHTWRKRNIPQWLL
jgi:hypothetical protein